MNWIIEQSANWVATNYAAGFDIIATWFTTAFGSDLSLFEAYFPIITDAYNIFQYTAWGLLFLIVVFQLFRAFGGPLTEVQESPWQLIVKAALFGFMIGYAKEIFDIVLTFARAPYTLMSNIDVTASSTWIDIDQVMSGALAQLEIMVTVVGMIIEIILVVMLFINYLKLLISLVERYVILGFLAYTSPMAFAMGASKSTSQVFRNWTRMVGTQLFIMVMNVWFFKAIDSCFAWMGTYGVTDAGGNMLLWCFCMLGMMKLAQRLDTYLAALGLTTATTAQGIGSDIVSFGRTMMMSMGRSFGHMGGGGHSGGAPASGKVSGGVTANSPGGPSIGVMTGGGSAAKGASTLSCRTVSNVAAGHAGKGASIAGQPADESLSGYMPSMKGYDLNDTKIEDGHISSTATDADGNQFGVELNRADSGYTPTDQDEIVTAMDGTDWYQTVTPLQTDDVGQASGDAGTVDPNVVGSSDAGAGPDVTTLETGEAAAGVSGNAPGGTTLETDGAAVGGATLEPNGGTVQPIGGGETVLTGNGGIGSAAQIPSGPAPAAGGASQPSANLGNTVLNGAAADQAVSGSFPSLNGYNLSGTTVENGHISTTVTRSDGGSAQVNMYDASQHSAPQGRYTEVRANDGSTWYQTVSSVGSGVGQATTPPPRQTSTPTNAGNVTNYNGQTVNTQNTTVTQQQQTIHQQPVQRQRPEERPNKFEVDNRQRRDKKDGEDRS